MIGSTNKYLITQPSYTYRDGAYELWRYSFTTKRDIMGISCLLEKHAWYGHFVYRYERWQRECLIYDNIVRFIC